jgi:hypothetical protein
MGIRGELFSTRFACDSRTYFFNVKQNRNGDVFLSIVESKPSEGESFDRRSIVVFGEQMEGFVKAFQSALKYIDKTGNKVDPDPNAVGFPHEDDERRKPDDGYRRREGAREGRSSSFREHGGPDVRANYRDRGSSESRPSSYKDRGSSDSRPSSYKDRGNSDSRPAPYKARGGSDSRPAPYRERGPAESRATSYKDRGSSDARPSQYRDRSSSEARPARKVISRAPAHGPSTEKPVKRIVVRKAKKPDNDA